MVILRRVLLAVLLVRSFLMFEMFGHLSIFRLLYPPLLLHLPPLLPVPPVPSPSPLPCPATFWMSKSRRVTVSYTHLDVYKRQEDRLYHIDPETAPIVQEIFTRYADGEPAEKIAASLNAVSYTHLDVYKRQTQTWLSDGKNFSGFCVMLQMGQCGKIS